SEASVTRLCRTLGCKGYNEFKMALALDLRQVQFVEHGGDEIDNVVNESVQATQDTAKLLDRALLEAAALALHQAQSV
ncbi:RpiR family transcriptional regulator, partial [Escherichia coli]|nr:RpiR family transcriptional regulator [Escherichia coli]